MRVATLIAGATVLVAVLALAALPAAGGVECDPYPIGRCGNEQRERVVFCYTLTPTGEFVSATDKHVVALGGNSVVAVDKEEKAEYYLRLRPYENFVNNPAGAPAPQKTIWDEKNNVPGLQIKAFTCADFVWFAECVPQQWMGPFNEVPKTPDAQVA